MVKFLPIANFVVNVLRLVVAIVVAIVVIVVRTSCGV